MENANFNFSSGFTLPQIGRPFSGFSQAQNNFPSNFSYLNLRPQNGLTQNDLSQGNLSSSTLADEVRKPDWKWPCFEEWYDPLAARKVRAEKVESTQQSSVIPFNVVYLRLSEDFCTTLVELSSQPLTKILRSILSRDEFPDSAINVEARKLYHVIEKLRDARDTALESTPEPVPVKDIENNAHDATSSIPPCESERDIEKIHLSHLIRFVEQEYNQTNKIRDGMREQKVISFDMLWVFYTKKSHVWYRCDMSGQQLGGIVSSTQETLIRGQRVFIITIQVIDCDGSGFKSCSIQRTINYFKGEMSFSDLPVVLFEFSDSRDFLWDCITENGKRFFDLALGNHFMNYSGPLLRWKITSNCMRVEKLRADGRVMIDLQSFVTMNPDYNMGNAMPPNRCDIELLRAKDVYLGEDKKTEENFRLAPALVYGFSFALKEWGQFEVSKFSEIRFDTGAFEHLVMSQDKKDILKGLVKQYGQIINDDEPADGILPLAKPLDPITNKGNGSIFLCHGPPGTGKTLTAESVAEYLRRPLWILSVHELGVKPDILEERMSRILDIAFTWKAILLLDEADIYLEKRNTSDLDRNAIVCIFLRLLEYYQGILFLTTNRVTTFDEAFCSRINMFFHYPKLGTNERYKIWDNFIRRASLPLQADNFAEYSLNGREIRNVIHTAQVLAKSQNKELNADIVTKVIKTFQVFREEINVVDDI